MTAAQTNPAAKGKPTPAAKGKPTPAAKGKPTPAAKGKLTPAAKGKPTPAAAAKPARDVPKVSPLRGTAVGDYIAKIAGWQGAVVAALCDLVQQAAPEAAVSIKWSQPVFEHNGPMIFIKPASKHVTFGFWRGTEIDAPEGLFEGSGDRMRHIKISGPHEVRHDLFVPMVRAAVALNRSKGDPTRRR